MLMRIPSSGITDNRPHVQLEILIEGFCFTNISKNDAHRQAKTQRP